MNKMSSAVDKMVVELDESQNEFCTSSAEEKKRFYPHDFVVQKDKQYPYEWTPTFGSILPPPPPGDSQTYDSTITNNDKSDSSTWKYEDGLTNDFHVLWGSSNLVRHVQVEDVGLVDRLLVKGQKVGNNEGEFGLVTSTQVKTTLQILGTNHVITDVDAKRLKPLSPFVRGVEILYENELVGIITHVKRANVCRVESFGRGKIFHIESNENDGFMKQDPYSPQGGGYPGQKTRLSAKQMEGVLWKGKGMNLFWKTPIKSIFSSPDVTYLSVAPIGITVQWLQRKPTSDSKSEEFIQPTMYIPAEELPKVDCIGIPSYETVQLNSIRTLKLDELRDGSNVTSYNTWMNGFRSQFMDQTDNFLGNQFYPPESIFTALTTIKTEIPVKVLLKQTYVTIEWENGRIEKMLASKVPIICAPKENRLFRTATVVRSSIESESRKYGIVQLSEDLVTSGSNTVLVKWLEPKELNDQDTVTDLGVHEESIYDICPHPEYTYYRLHTLVFLKKVKFGITAGVVIDMDIRTGTMRIAGQSCQDLITCYPHEIIPLRQKSYWNFFTRKWAVDSMLPHEHQFIADREIPAKTQKPISLHGINNNASCPKLKTSLWDEPQFAILASAPSTHYYHPYQLKDMKPDFSSTIKKEYEILSNFVAEGIWIKAYEDRMDLLSILYLGPAHTPYEDGIFLFDLQLTGNFPDEKPKIQYIPYSDNLSPLISSDGGFCTSKIQWNSVESKPISFIGNFVLQIQSLLFSTIPYYTSDINKLFENTPIGNHLARVYNEKVFMNVLTSAINMLKYPHDPWRAIIGGHFTVALVPKLSIALKWLQQDDENEVKNIIGEEELNHEPVPMYPLLPLSKGFQIGLTNRVEVLMKMLQPDDTKQEDERVLQDSGYQELELLKNSTPSETTFPFESSTLEEVTEIEEIAAED